MGKQILLLGIGQSGCEVGEAFLHKMQNVGFGTCAFAIDTDARTFDSTPHSVKVPMVNSYSLYTTVDKLGNEWVQSFFPSKWEEDGTEFAKRLAMDTGANLWRMKSLVSFFSYLADKQMSERFHNELKAVAELAADDGIELYTVASTVGGTGSGLFLPITLYVKKYLKSIGAKILSSTCMLAMPEIYDNVFSAEQKTKAYANAYSALAELNAVNITTLCDDNKKHPPIDFRIGDEKAKCGVLFDTGKDKFRNRELAPFDKVIIFERTPGVNSVSAHIEAMAETLSSVARYETEETQTENKTAIYEGVALTKISYSPDSITKYISKVQTEAILGSELAAIHKETSIDTKKRAAEALRIRSRGNLDEIEKYCDSLISRAKAPMLDVGSDKAFIGRIEELPADAEAASPWEDDYELWAKKKVVELCALMDSTLECDEAVGIRGIIECKNYKIKLDKPKKVFGKIKDVVPEENYRAPTKKEAEALLLKNVTKTRRLLVGLADNLNEALVSCKDSFTGSVLSDVGELSVIQATLSDGRHMHPTLALLRLCLLYKTLKPFAFCENPDIAELLVSDTPFSETELLTENAKGRPTKYSRVGQKRLVAITSEKLSDDSTLVYTNRKNGKNYLLNDTKRVLKFTTVEDMRKKLLDGGSQFYRDLDFVYERIWGAAKSIRYTQALEAIGELITKYRALLDALAARRDDMLTDVKLASINGSSDTSTLVNVATSPKEKAAAYAEYLSIYRADGDTVASDDGTVGSMILDAVSKGESAESVIEKTESLYKERFEGSGFYAENLEKNVLEAALDSMAGRFGDSGLGFGKIFRERFSPLRIIRDGDFPERREIKTTTVAIFPKQVWDSIEADPDTFGGVGAREYFEKKMYDSGEYHGTATVSDEIDSKEFHMIRRMSGVALHLFESFNETSRAAVAYEAYKKAKEEARVRSSAMWDPDLIYRRDDDLCPPMISPVARRDYEMSVARAILFGLVSGEIYLAKYEDAGEVYFTYHDAVSEPVTVNEKTVGEKQIKELFAFAYANPAFTERLAGEYRVLFEEKYTVGGGFASKREFASAFARSEKITRLTDAFSSLLIKLYSAKALDDSGYAPSLADTVNESIMKISLNGKPSLDESSAWLYNALVECFMSKLIKCAKGERAKTLVTWLNSGGRLLSFAPPKEFKNYEL